MLKTMLQNKKKNKGVSKLTLIYKIKMLERNVFELQEQLARANRRIVELRKNKDES